MITLNNVSDTPNVNIIPSKMWNIINDAIKRDNDWVWKMSSTIVYVQTRHRFVHIRNT